MLPNNTTVLCHGASVCHRNAHVLLYTITRNKKQVELQESYGKVAEARNLEVSIVLNVFMVCLVCCGRTRFPCLSQGSLSMYSSHGSCPTKLSCGKVAERYLEPGSWFFEARVLGLRPQPFGRQARVRRQFENQVFLSREQMGFAKSMLFFATRTNRTSGDSSKTMVCFCCGKKWVFQKWRRVCHFLGNSCRVQRLFF